MMGDIGHDLLVPRRLLGCGLEHLPRCAEATASTHSTARRLGPCSIPDCLMSFGAVDHLVSWALVALGAERGATFIVEAAACLPGRVIFGLVGFTTWARIGSAPLCDLAWDPP